MLIAGDIGGTKTDLAIYSIESGPHAPLAQAEFHSADYQSLQAMVSGFLAQAKLPVGHASFDVAGPVINGHVKTTNLPWVMDEISLAKDLNLKSVHLMNDLEAVARAVPVLRPNDFVTLNEGQRSRRARLASSRPGPGWVKRFSPGMNRNTWRTARRAVTRISRQPTSGRSICSSTCWSGLITWASNGSAPVSAYLTFIMILATPRT